MLGQLPKPISECIESIQTEIIQYYDYGFDSHKYINFRTLKSNEYTGQKYATVITVLDFKVKPEYKNYKIALPRRVRVSEITYDVIEDKLNKLGF